MSRAPNPSLARSSSPEFEPSTTATATFLQEEQDDPTWLSGTTILQPEKFGNDAQRVRRTENHSTHTPSYFFLSSFPCPSTTKWKQKASGLEASFFYQLRNDFQQGRDIECLGMVGDWNVSNYVSVPYFLFLFFYPRKLICQCKVIEGLNPDTFLGLSIMFSFWAWYSYVGEQSIYFILVNCLGVALQIIYLVTYSRFIVTAWKRLCYFGIIGLSLFVVMVATSLLAFPTRADRVLFVGTCSDIVSVLVYFTPIAILSWNKVVHGIPPTPMPRLMIIPPLVRAVVWLGYGAVAGNMVVAVSSVAGLLSGAIHGVVYLCYPTPTPTTTETPTEESSLLHQS